APTKSAPIRQRPLATARPRPTSELIAVRSTSPTRRSDAGGSAPARGVTRQPAPQLGDGDEDATAPPDGPPHPGEVVLPVDPADTEHLGRLGRPYGEARQLALSRRCLFVCGALSP